MRCCDSCGDVLRKVPFKLTLRADYFIPDAENPYGEDEYEKALDKNFTMEICNNCTSQIPKLLKEMRDRVRGQLDRLLSISK